MCEWIVSCIAKSLFVLAHARRNIKESFLSLLFVNWTFIIYNSIKLTNNPNPKLWFESRMHILLNPPNVTIKRISIWYYARLFSIFAHGLLEVSFARTRNIRWILFTLNDWFLSTAQLKIEQHSLDPKQEHIFICWQQLTYEYRTKMLSINNQRWRALQSL